MSINSRARKRCDGPAVGALNAESPKRTFSKVFKKEFGHKSKGDHLGPKIPKHLKRMASTKNVHTSGTFSNILEKMSKNILNHVPIYRVKYTESKSDIQNNDLLYTTHQQCQNTLDLLEQMKTLEKSNL